MDSELACWSSPLAAYVFYCIMTLICIAYGGLYVTEVHGVPSLGGGLLAHIARQVLLTKVSV